ncbi:ankyrin repeat domain-containing protein [Saccharothrix sp. NRRL B-16348]|uniref:ankyrin repeat domain-containing protein n=1 Tax=Saccharothrix sp. NRRL B-16348 TaxID=1415542 RepID=UPI0006AF88AC|nr:ankyrin repeat domain-containing protein [Saccharothrix sp. NRRL B-16348]
MVETARTREIVTRLFADVQSGNLDGVLAALGEDIVFDLPGNEFNTVIPNLRTWRGKDDVVEAFRLRTLDTEILEFEQRDLVVEGDRAFVLNYQKIGHKHTGMAVEFEFTMLLKVGEDELVHEWRAFFDSAPEIALFRSDIDQRLLAAVRAGDDERVRTLLRDGADPDRREATTGLTPLQVAAGLGRVGTVSALLDGGADVHGVDTRAGCTALHKAVQNGDPATVRALVEAGAFIDAVAPTTGHTALMDALWYKHPEVVGYLLDQGAGVNLSTHYGFSMKEHFEFELNVNSLGKEKLLEAEKLLKGRESEDERRIAEQELMTATAAGDTARVRRLLADGAEVDARYPVRNGFNDLHTPLLVATRDGHLEIVRELLAAGADVNATEPTFGACPLHKAVYNGHGQITALLVTAPGVDLDFQGATNGYTPLHDALWHGYDECARTLLDAGARTDLVGHDGKTPLDVALDVFDPDHPIIARLRAA